MASKGENKEINVLMVSFSAQGHMNPMLRLAERLISKGLNLTFATTEPARDSLLSSSTTAGIRLEFYSDGLSVDFDRKSSMDHFMETIGKYGPINLSSLIKNSSTKFSCIINNPFVPWVADVAVEHGIPCAMLWIQPCTLYAIYYRYYNELNLFPTSVNPNLSTVKLPGLPFLETHDLPSFLLPSNTYGTFPKLLKELFQNMNKIKWVLGNSINELEKDVIDSMENLHPIKPVGPLVSNLLDGNQRSQIEDESIQWLNLQKPKSVIYISFGTIVELSKNEVKIMAETLMKNKFKFLWVLKVNAEKEMLPQGFIEETKEQGLVVKWCPQVHVLEHSAVACFLTHCGWNSLIESITAGVPVIGYPQWTDQPTNAKLIDILKTGLRLWKGENGEFSGEELEKCMQDLMVGEMSEQYKKNAAELRRAAKMAVADGGSSDRNIQWFIDEIRGASYLMQTNIYYTYY